MDIPKFTPLVFGSTRMLYDSWKAGLVKLLFVRAGDQFLIQGKPCASEVVSMQIDNKGQLWAQDCFSRSVGNKFHADGSPVTKSVNNVYLAVAAPVAATPVSTPKPKPLRDIIDDMVSDMLFGGVRPSDKPGIVAAAQAPKVAPPVPAVKPAPVKSFAGLLVVHNPDVRRVQAIG